MEFALVTIMAWLAWLPEPVVATVIVTLAVVIAYSLHKTVRRLLTMALANRYPYVLATLNQMRGGPGSLRCASPANCICGASASIPMTIFWRKHLTQVRVLVRTADVMVVIFTFGACLMTFEPVRQYGVSLFASAGVAGLVAGLAARPVLSNLFAGVQLAMMQPPRPAASVALRQIAFA